MLRQRRLWFRRRSGFTRPKSARILSRSILELATRAAAARLGHAVHSS